MQNVPQADSMVPDGVQGLDRYAYVNNSPIKYTDPSGHLAYEFNDKHGNCMTLKTQLRAILNPSMKLRSEADGMKMNFYS